MSRITVFTLTRDRAEYTKRAILSLFRNAGCKYKHVVWDNGSVDGTKEILHDFKRQSIIQDYEVHPVNVGIKIPINNMIDLLMEDKEMEFLLKFDNDCEVCSPLILDSMLEIYALWNKTFPDKANKLILAPHVAGLNYPVKRLEYLRVGQWTLGIVPMVGGIFQMTPVDFWKEGFRQDLSGPMGKEAESYLCQYARDHGYIIANVENLLVLHMDGTKGQEKNYPEYFKRKTEEGSL